MPEQPRRRSVRSIAECDVPSPGERVCKTGMVFAATPASDFICGTLPLASA
jgi:galactarate dehydratase